MNFLSSIQRAIFPVECIKCELYGSYLCQACFLDVKLNQESSCLGCAKKTLLGAVCADCKDKIALDHLLIAADYDQEVIQRLVWLLKYNFIKEMGEVAAEIIHAYLKQNFLPEMIRLSDASLVPIPLYHKKLRFRGFNQSRLIADGLSKSNQWPVSETLVRIKNTGTQTHFDKFERRQNLKSSFEYSNLSPVSDTVILVDDVVTTGSTLNEAAKVLKAAGVKRVIGLALARRQ